MILEIFQAIMATFNLAGCHFDTEWSNS